MIDLLKRRILTARKNLSNIERDILSVILGECQTLEARSGKISDEEVYNIIRKQIEANKEVLKILPDNFVTKQENIILESLLPQYLTQEQIKQVLMENITMCNELQKEGNEGKAIGLAIKFCKQNNLNVIGNDVKIVVASIRNSHG